MGGVSVGRGGYFQKAIYYLSQFFSEKIMRLSTRDSSLKFKSIPTNFLLNQLIGSREFFLHFPKNMFVFCLAAAVIWLFVKASSLSLFNVLATCRSFPNGGTRHQNMPGIVSCLGARLLNWPFTFSPSLGLISRAFFISSMEPSLSPFSSLARPRS